jgi:hypothetical protein
MGVPAETSRRLACDASRVVMQHGQDGRTLHDSVRVGPERGGRDGAALLPARQAMLARGAFYCRAIAIRTASCGETR